MYNPPCTCCKSLLWYQQRNSSSLTPTLFACCGVGSWSRQNSCQSVREAVCWLPRHSPSLPRSNLPRPASCSVAEDSSSWINAYCRHIIPKKTHYLTCTPPTSWAPKLHPAGVRLWLPLSALLTPCTSTSIGSFPSPLLAQWSLFVLTLQMD